MQLGSELNRRRLSPFQNLLLGSGSGLRTTVEQNSVPFPGGPVQLGSELNRRRLSLSLSASARPRLSLEGTREKNSVPISSRKPRKPTRALWEEDRPLPN